MKENREPAVWFFPLFFVAAALVFTVTLGLCRRLEEPEAGSMDDLLHDLLEQTLLLVRFRFWSRG